ncbi:MAG: hypothetical protein EH224_03055 [Calditrichaeota bacterium]|nr:MAG: hypothetical protein EH224_03055 [Calditrichota bacterium]
MKDKSFLLLILLFVFSCQEINEKNIPNSGNIIDHGEFVNAIIYPDTAAFIINDRVNTANGIKLSIGSYQDFSATSLLKFIYLPDTSNELDSVYLHLYPESIFGDPEGLVTINLYQPIESWDESANTEDYWHNPGTMNFITSIEVVPDDSTTIIIPLEDKELIKSWQRDTVTMNHGIYLQMNSSDFLYEFHSFESSNTTYWPRLMYKVWENDTTFYYDSTNIGLDATIFDYTPDGAENIFEIAKSKNNLIISSGISAHTLLKFNLKDKLPKEAVLYSADLKLFVNDYNIIDESEGNLLDNPDHDGSFFIRLITEWNNDFTKMGIDSTFQYTNILTQTDDYLNLSHSYKKNFGQFAIQDLINGDINIEGLLIQYIMDGQDISVKRIYSLDDSVYAPSLNLQYYKITTSGF